MEIKFHDDHETMHDDPTTLLHRNNITPNFVRTLIHQRCSRTLEALLEIQDVDWTIIEMLDLDDFDLIYLASLSGWYEIMKTYTFCGNHSTEHLVDLLIALDPTLDLLWYAVKHSNNSNLKEEVSKRGYKKQCCLIL